MLQRYLLKSNAVIFLLTTFLMLFSVPKANALDVTANSCSEADIEAAVAEIVAAGGSGTVYIPAGDCTWTGTVYVSGPISFIGAGYDNTILRRGAGDHFNHTGAGTFVRYSGIGFYGQPSGVSGTSTAIYLSSADNFRIDNNKFYRSKWHGVVTFKRCTKGVVDHNIFERATDGTSNYGIQLGQNSGTDKPATCTYSDPTCQATWEYWWDDTTNNNGNVFDENFPAGSDKMIYVEDNTFRWSGPALEGNWGSKLAVVFRYNTVYKESSSSGFAIKPGAQWAEAYNNYFECTMPNCDTEPQGTGSYFRSSGLFYNNTLKNIAKSGIFAAYYCAYGYCYTDQSLMDETYIFSNTYINANCGEDSSNCWTEWSEGAPERIAENQNYFFRAPQAGDRIYPYTPYIYPHPLVTGSLQTCSELGGVDCCDNVDYVCPDTAYSGASDCGDVCCSVACVLETNPPVISNAQPSADLISGTTQTSISLDTDEVANCKYALTPGGDYQSMTNTFSATDATTHATTVTGLTDGGTYAYYVSCQDTKGNYNTDDFVISFGVSYPDTTPPVISNVVVTPASNSATITWDTDEPAGSRVDYGLTASYGLFDEDLSLKQSHSISLTNLNTETTYYFNITSVDASGNPTAYNGQFATTAFSGWQTPVNIVNYCGESASNPAANFVDEDTASLWHHWKSESHSVVFDMGESIEISKIRLWHKKYGSSFAGVTEIYVSENTTDWGTSLGSLPAVPNSEPTGWKETDITNKNGRYVRILSELRGSTYWREFEAYVSPRSTGTIITINTPQDTWFNVTSVPPGVDIDFYDEDGLDGAWYKLGSNGAWIPVFSGLSGATYTTDFTITDYVEGPNGIYFKVTDDLGNIYEPTATDTLTIRVDTTRPTGTIGIQ